MGMDGWAAMCIPLPLTVPGSQQATIFDDLLNQNRAKIQMPLGSGRMGPWVFVSTWLATGSPEATWASEPQIATARNSICVKLPNFQVLTTTFFFNVGGLPIHKQRTHLAILNLLERGLLLHLRRSAAKKRPRFSHVTRVPTFPQWTKLAQVFSFLMARVNIQVVAGSCWFRGSIKSSLLF